MAREQLQDALQYSCCRGKLLCHHQVGSLRVPSPTHHTQTNSTTTWLFLFLFNIANQSHAALYPKPLYHCWYPPKLVLAPASA